MKHFLFFFILLATLNSASYAEKKSHFEWAQTQAGCKVASKALAEDALKLSEVHLLIKQIMEVTKPYSKERMEGIKVYEDAMDRVKEKWRKKFREYRQSTNINEALLAAFIETATLSATSLSMTHPGKDLEWYQDKIFDECVKDD